MQKGILKLPQSDKRSIILQLISRVTVNPD